MGDRFADKVAIVTGGTSGIGLATAERLLAEGARVVIAGRRVPEGEAALVALDAGDRAAFQPTDVTNTDQVAALVAVAAERFGRLDVVVNAAGAVVVGPFDRSKPAHWRKTIDVNLTGVLEVCHAALPQLRATIAAGLAGGAAIVNVASLDGVRGDKGMVVYSAAKAGVVNLTRSLALELAGEGIRVNSVCPGAVDTPMTVSTAKNDTVRPHFARAIPVGRFGQPHEIAAAIAFLAADEASFITGANLLADGGVTAATGHPDLLAIFGLD